MLSVRFGWLVASVMLTIFGSTAHAQTEARKREAAAQAYDQGTTAYVAQDYEKAAEWFETANRMSPAAPALIQAARAHQQAGHLARAATLALALVQTYPDEANAAQFGEGLLNDLSGKLVRVDVECDAECTLDVDGTLQENHSFFVDPDAEHTVTASFETGERREQVSGKAGESKSLSFDAPPPGTQRSDDLPPPEDGPSDTQAAPLSPVFTYVGIGLTAALLVGSIASTLDVYSGADDYEAAAEKWSKSCIARMPESQMVCDMLKGDAKSKLDEGQGKETRTTVLWVATGAAAAVTTVIAVALTDWSGDEAQETASRRVRLAVGATDQSAELTLKGTF
jgi:tetratricopeptide (TPR) repeat protein